MCSNKGSRLFRISDYDVVGFDLDGCLLKYKWNPFFECLHNYVMTYLTRVNHYDPSCIQPFHKGWKEVMFRGVFVDTRHGNLLWVLEDGMIQRAFHGRERLSAEEISSIYPQSKLPVLGQLLKNFNNTEEYHMIDNYFEGPLVMIYSDLILAFDRKTLDTGLSYQKIWDDIFNAYLDFYVPETTEMATRFIDISFHPEQYGVQCSKLLKDWLKQLKRENKYVFLMTSSTVLFAKGILQYILGEDFNEYFDFGIGRAGKPSFFYCQRKFVDVDDIQAVVSELKPKKWYEYGCLNIFMDLLERFTGIKNPKVLYVGDGLKNDAFPASRFAHWGALIILEGLEVEGCSQQSSAQSQMKIHLHKIVTDDEALYVGNNPVWGSFFYDNGKETLFARVIREGSDIAVPWLDYIADLPLEHPFTRFDKDKHNPDNLGYYPPLHIRNQSS